MVDSRDVRVFFSILGVFCFCCANVHCLEALLKLAPSCANFITFSQFAFVSGFELIFTSKFFTAPTHVSVWLSTLNNYVLTLDIPMPLHMVFRSVRLFLNRFSGRQYVNGALVSGSISVTLSDPSPSWDFPLYTLGISIMVGSLFLSSLMGVLQVHFLNSNGQESISRKFGRYPREMLFYTLNSQHFLSLPGFLLISSNISAQFSSFKTISHTFEVSEGIEVKTVWFLLLLNIFTQYACVRCVYVLTTECTSLTVTMVTTFRRFLSLIWSIYRFKNPFTAYHALGSSLVFLGTLTFVDFHVQKTKQK
ncbi:LOW QUALITY PROTEIN: hypothetical protein MXB_278 [Myxobolus squamalis]|nr:LOW QUALITY PROTEIN: hypothetical protein MXB_278 [Myxobolus squamalis]